jgi:hypothetical protein
MQALQNLPPIVALVLGLVLLAWLVLVFLVPFMIEGIRQSARKTHEELAEMNLKLDRLNATLMQNPPAADRRPSARAEAHAPAEAETRGRREPTISDTGAVPTSRRRDRREPIVK